MTGIVGKLRVAYRVGERQAVDEVDIHHTREFFLSACPRCRMVIDEVTYIVDTIYGLTVYPDGDEEEALLVFGNQATEFCVEKYGLRGELSLIFV